MSDCSTPPLILDESAEPPSDRPSSSPRLLNSERPATGPSRELPPPPPLTRIPGVLDLSPRPPNGPTEAIPEAAPRLAADSPNVNGPWTPAPTPVATPPVVMTDTIVVNWDGAPLHHIRWPLTVTVTDVTAAPGNIRMLRFAMPVETTDESLSSNLFAAQSAKNFVHGMAQGARQHLETATIALHTTVSQARHSLLSHQQPESIDQRAPKSRRRAAAGLFTNEATLSQPQQPLFPGSWHRKSPLSARHLPAPRVQQPPQPQARAPAPPRSGFEPPAYRLPGLGLAPSAGPIMTAGGPMPSQSVAAAPAHPVVSVGVPSMNGCRPPAAGVPPAPLLLSRLSGVPLRYEVTRSQPAGPTGPAPS